MAQMQTQSNGAATRQNVRDAFATILSPEDAKAIREAIVADGPRLMAEILAKEAIDRPKIPIQEGKLIPADFDGLFRIAIWIETLKTYGAKEKGGAFRLYNVPEIAAIVAAGLRVGMDPFYALETIGLINNKTCIYGRGIRGVVMASGLCEDWQELREGFSADGIPGDRAKVTVTVKRKGFPTPFVGVFSVANAIQAGLWGGNEYSPWRKYPGDMLTWRAVSRAVLGFSDVLGGLRVAEEVIDQAEQEERPTAAAELNKRLAEMDVTDHGTDAGREVVLPPASDPARVAVASNNAYTLTEPASTDAEKKPETKPEPSLGGADAKPPAEPAAATPVTATRRTSAPKGSIFGGGEK